MQSLFAYASYVSTIPEPSVLSFSLSYSKQFSKVASVVIETLSLSFSVEICGLVAVSSVQILSYSATERVASSEAFDVVSELESMLSLPCV